MLSAKQNNTVCIVKWDNSEIPRIKLRADTYPTVNSKSQLSFYKQCIKSITFTMYHMILMKDSQLLHKNLNNPVLVLALVYRSME
jgi:hypothetical protein